MTAVDGYRFAEAGISGVMLCGREHLSSLEESSMEEVKAAIRSESWLEDYYDIGEKYIRTKNRRVHYVFTGLRHNLGSLKSKARILRAWIDEAEDVSEAAWTKLIPTVRAEATEAQRAFWDWQSELWISYNPEKEDSATNRRFYTNAGENTKVINLQYYDNPWFPKVLDAERLEDQIKRPETYDHVWLGDYLVLTEAQIFKDHFVKEEFTPDETYHGPYYGLDFGFANDALAAVECYVKDNTLFIRRELFKKKLELDDTASAFAKAFPRGAMHVIRADNARPESISYLSRHGLPRIVACKKGRGSIEDGVAHIKAYDQVVIHPDCPELYREFTKYSYKVDKLSGDILPVIVDAFNHGIDATRYALEPMIKAKTTPGVRAL
jgi:phage terminase large subunit